MPLTFPFLGFYRKPFSRHGTALKFATILPITDASYLWQIL